MMTHGWKVLAAVSFLMAADTVFAVPAKKKGENAAETSDASRSIDALIATLGDDDPRKRAEAAASLERIVGAERKAAERDHVLQALKAAAASNADLEIRAQAADVLRKVGLGADREEAARLLVLMKKARDIDEGTEAYEKILNTGRAGAEALAEEFSADKERYGARERLYKLEAALSLGKKGPLAPGEEAVLSATLTNRGMVGIWINPTAATMEIQLEKVPGKRVSMGRQLADGIGEMYFERAFTKRACTYFLLHLAPGESHTLTYGVASGETGTLSFSFNYGAEEREAVQGNIERTRLFAKAMNAEVPEQIAWPTPFRTIGADLQVPVAGNAAVTPGLEGKPLFPADGKAPLEE